MTICYFGDYDPNYSRNRVIIKGLKENGVSVLECRTLKPGISGYLSLYKQHKKIAKKYDILFIGYSCNVRSRIWIVLLARILTKKKIVLDAFYSLYDSWIYDKRLAKEKGIKAALYWLMDWAICRMADKILLDTEAHINYFVKTFKIEKNKFLKALVGSDPKIFFPRKERKSQEDGFLIHFHGKFIPLQGVNYIVEAAKLLESVPEIRFNLIGNGQTYTQARQIADKLKVRNVSFIDPAPYEKLPEYMAASDLCLGIFGNTDKAKRVIPNKVYEAVAMEKPVLTGDTPAIRELFEDKKNIILCNTADPKDLAKKILKLKNDIKLRKIIFKNGYDLFNKNALPKIIAKKLLEDL